MERNSGLGMKSYSASPSASASGAAGAIAVVFEMCRVIRMPQVEDSPYAQSVTGRERHAVHHALPAWLVAAGCSARSVRCGKPRVCCAHLMNGKRQIQPCPRRRRATPRFDPTHARQLTSRRIEKSYRAVYLENQYLRVTVLPELGGRVYAIFDKTAGRDALYTNHVVKYSLIGIRGAWISGEASSGTFADGHTCPNHRLAGGLRHAHRRRWLGVAGWWVIPSACSACSGRCELRAAAGYAGCSRRG